MREDKSDVPVNFLSLKATTKVGYTKTGLPGVAMCNSNCGHERITTQVLRDMKLINKSAFVAHKKY